MSRRIEREPSGKTRVGFVMLAAAVLAACSGPNAGEREDFDQLEQGHRVPSVPREQRETTLFEAASVRPIAVRKDGHVAVTNTPDDTLELFRPSHSGVKSCGSVKVGMRPVAAAWVGDDVWVVNHLSDSISVVALDRNGCSGHVARTLQVGDEPRDIVTTRKRGKTYVFVTTAHRGQNVETPEGEYRDPELTTPSVGRADVFVFAPESFGRPGTERPLKIINLFSDTPRALAVGHDKVYAAAFLSGNRTAVLRYQFVIDRGRKSYRALDADGDFTIDPDLPAEQRVIEGGYPAVSGNGRCISAQTTTQSSNDFIMDICVQTDPGAPYQAVGIVPQVSGQYNSECGCTNGLGELQRTPPLIVRFHDDPASCGDGYDASIGGCWLDAGKVDDFSNPVDAQQWNAYVPFTLPDRDVFTLSLESGEPELDHAEDFTSVGTTLFSLAVHPGNGTVFVGNTEARNHVRFEGPGQDEPQSGGFGNTSVRGHIAESRITVLDPVHGSVKPVHLNGHIDYSQCCAPTPNAESERSLAFPVGLAITSKKDRHGRVLEQQDLYVAAMGSDKIAVLPTQVLAEANGTEAIQNRSMHIEVEGGPAGLALDEDRKKLYVLTRFDNKLVVIDTRTRRTVQKHPLFNPEAPSVTAGRRFLYDARNTSSHGDSACASCHIFGDLDGLAWDLGDPNAVTVENAGPFFSKPEVLSAPLNSHFLALKGAMTTQSLRGMANHGTMHWRGDRRDNEAPSVQPDSGAYDEEAAFKAFNVAFPGLNGRHEALTEDEMDKFTKFVLQLTYPPNPIRALDDSLDEGQKRARSRYFGCEVTDESMLERKCADGRDIEEETLHCNCLNPPRFVLGLEPRPDYCPPEPHCNLEISDFQNTCHGCHTWNPAGNLEFDVDKPGFFGTSGVYTNDAVAHILKVPHLRNLYQKVGMFGSYQSPDGIGLRSIGDSILGARRGGLLAKQNRHMGDQIRGFGFTHAGEEDTLFHFFSLSGFVRNASPGVAFPNDNLAGFEPVLPLEPETCLDDQLPALNGQFLGALAPPAQLQQLGAWLGTLNNPAATEAEKAAAFAGIVGFIASLPPENPGSVFQLMDPQSAVSQLALPLAACGSLPDYATLEQLGCFDLATSPSCSSLVGLVKGCSLWGATLEEILPNGTQACMAAGLRDKADTESLMLAFDSNEKPIVGQQVTMTVRAPEVGVDRLRLILGQANAGHCDVVASGRKHGYLYRDGRLLRDDGRTVGLDQALRRERALTYTAVPPRDGRGSAIDRDGDGFLNGIEERYRSNPSDPTDTPRRH